MTELFQPPADVESEEALIGAIFIDPEQINALTVTPDDFKDDKHKWIFAAMQKLAKRGDGIDSLTVQSELGKKRLKDIGGAAYLTRLITLTPTAYNAPTYAAKVIERARDRRLIQSANELLQAANKGNTEEARKVLERAQEIAAGRGVDRWAIYTLAESYKPRPPLQYLVSGLLLSSSLSIVYGAPGVMKSMLLADMCICVASGLRWLDPLPSADGAGRDVLQSPVMWLDFDNGKRRTDERFESLARVRDLPDTTPLYYVAMPSPSLDATSRDSINDLSRRLKKRDVKLAVIDNLGVINGKADENAPEMANVMAGLRWLAEDSGAAVVIIHHQRKSNGTVGRAGETLRGHSSIEAAIDLALLVERDDHADSLTIRSTKTRGADVFPFGAQFTYEHKPETKELAAARFFGVPVDDLVSDHAVEREVIAVVGAKKPINKGDLTSEVKKVLPDVGVNRIRGMIDRLDAGGKLTSTTGTRGAKQYDLPK